MLLPQHDESKIERAKRKDLPAQQRKLLPSKEVIVAVGRDCDRALVLGSNLNPFLTLLQFWVMPVFAAYNRGRA
jgi:hypothetical protein